LNPRPLGYEPNELPDCSTPHRARVKIMSPTTVVKGRYIIDARWAQSSARLILSLRFRIEHVGAAVLELGGR
jgi:hypothetical protein